MDVYEKMYETAAAAPYGYLLVDISRQTCYIGRTLMKVGAEEAQPPPTLSRRSLKRPYMETIEEDRE